MLAIGATSTGSGTPAVGYTDEQVRDTIAAALTAGSNVSIVVDDAGDTITISASVPAGYTDEQAQDAFAALIAAGTHSGIAFVYNDAGNAISATVPAAPPADGSVTNAKVATGAAIAESKLALASDAAAGTASRRTLGTGAQQAAAGNHNHDAAYAAALTPTATKTDAYTAASGELVMVDASGGPVTITAPALAARRSFGVKKLDSSSNVVTIAAAGSDTIGSQSSATFPLRTNDQATYFTYNPNATTNWVATYNHLSLASLDARYPATATVPAAERTVTANTTAVVGETLRVNATSGAVTITPPASPVVGSRVFLVKTDSSTNTVTWSGTVSGDTGGVVLSAAGAGATLIYSGGGWQLESTTAAATGRTGSGSAPTSAGARNGVYDPRTNVYSPSGGSGRLLRAQLAKAANGGTPNSGSQLVDLVCLGDSRTAGYYSGATPSDSWPSQLRYRLAAAGFPSAGTGLVQASNNSTAIDSRIALSGSWSAQYPYQGWTASGSTATFTSDFATTAGAGVVEVYYYGNSGSFTVKIGAAAAVSVTPPGSTTVEKRSFTGQTISVGTQITVTSTSSAGYLIGFCVRNTTGVLVHSVAWGGISSSTVAATGAITLQGITSAINPSVLLLMIGCNDSGSSVSATTHATNLATITSTNNPNAAKGLICQSPNPTYIDAWPAYVAAQYDRADTLGCPLLDLNDRYVSPALGNAAGLLGSDNTHETVTGATDLARAVTTMLAS